MSDLGELGSALDRLYPGTEALVRIRFELTEV